MPSRDLVPVSFSVEAPVKFGETVHVVGNVPALGSWKVEYGVQLVTTPFTYPKWSTQDTVPLFSGHKVQYKYAIFSGGSFSRWEESPGFRNITVSGTSVEVTDTILVADSETPPLRPPERAAGSRRSLAHDRAMSRRKLLNYDLDHDDGIIIALYFLPVRISRNKAPKKHNFKNKAFVEKSMASKLSDFATAEETENKFYIDWDESALLSRKKSSVADKMRIVYIGVPNCDFEILPSEQDALQAALLPFRCIPVFLTAEVHRLSYEVYCMDTLRQLFHHQVSVYGPLPTRWWHRSLHEAAWQAYCTSNRAFAEKIIEYVSEGDIIWIHGYELLLLPSFLARKLQQVEDVSVGLFIHSPFPSSEIFRTLSVREEILRGMLNADQIGFHLYEYARPFLSCCHRILGIPENSNETMDQGYLSVDYQGRHVLVTVCHAGTEPDLIRSKITSPAVAETAQLLLNAATIGPDDDTVCRRYTNQDQVILVGIDKLDYLSGIHFKLTWYEYFLAEHPEWQDRLCVLQVCLDFASSDSAQCRAEVKNIARRINAAHPRPEGRRPAVCLLEWKAASLEDRIALFAIADIFLLTPLRAGLNLDVLEFTLTVVERNLVKGPWSNSTADIATSTSLQDKCISELRNCPALILSEFTAAFRVLPGSLRVNPWRRMEMYEALSHALMMHADERKHRQDRALIYCEKHDESGWAAMVLNDIKKSRSSSESKVTDMNSKVESFKFSGVGLGLNFRAIEFRKDFEHLNKDTVAQAYRKSRSRLILLDYGGTTVSDENPEDASLDIHASKFEFRYRPPGEAIMPSDLMQDALLTLVDDPNNQVYIVSGRDRQELETAFAGIPGIGLSAEHGSYYTWTQSVSANDEGCLRLQQLPLRNISQEQEQLLSLKRSQRSNSVSSQEETASTRPPANDTRRICVKDLKRQWLTRGDHFDDTWMDLSQQIMDIYTQRTDGTYIERKDSSIVWQFRDAEGEFGILQAKELQDHLHQMLKSFKVEVVSGKGYVEVCPLGVDKGQACEHILATVWPNDLLPDFVMCIGDDIADESMFQFCQQIQESGNSEPARMTRLQSSPALMTATSNDHPVFSVVVGEKPSSAHYYLNDVDEVCDLLSVLAKVSTRTQRATSLIDMATLQQNKNGFISTISPISEDGPSSPRILEVRLIRASSEEPRKEAAAAAVAASKSHLDLSRLGLGSNPASLKPPKMISSSSMPLLSEYFSLDRSLPSSRNIHEYLDSLENEDEEGIIF